MDPNERRPHSELGRLLGLIAHDLRNPLAAVYTNVEVLEEEPELSEDAREALADTKIALGEAQRGLEQIAWIAQWLEGTTFGELSRGDLACALRSATASAEIPVDLRVEPGVSVRGASLLGRVVQVLLANARDHAPKGAARVEATRRGDEVVIDVCDDGPAIAQELLTLAFELGGQASLKARPGGRYARFAGLFACRAAIEGLGGTLSAGGRDGAAYFRIVLPAAD